MKKIYVFILACVVGLLFTNNSFGALTLKINNKTQAQIVNDTICAGSEYIYNATVTSIPPGVWTYPIPRWTGSGTAYISFGDVNSNTIGITCFVPGNYVLTFSATQGGITTSITQTIVVKSKDNLTLVLPSVSPFEICEGSTVNFQASDASNYYWQRDDGSDTYPISVGTGPTVVETPPGVGTWKYRVYGESLGGCATNPEYYDFQVVVDLAPTVNTGGPYTTCYGTPIVLNGSIGGSATSAQWIGGAGSFSPNRNTLNATYTPALSEAGTSVSLTLRTDDPPGVCSYAESNTTLTVNPLPTSITGVLNVCEGSTTTLSDATAGGTWSSATPSVATINSSGVVSGVSAGTSVISYTLSTGCYVTATVTVNPLPAAITGTTDVCVGSTTTLSSSTVGGTWSSATTSVATINSSGVVTGVSAGTSVIYYTLPTGCFVVTTVTVNPLPAAITGTTNVCVGSTTMLANATGGGTWSSATPSVATIDASGVVTGVSSGTSIIYYTLPTGCYVTTTVTVNPLPAAITGTTSVCVASTTTLSNATAGGTWSSATTSVATIDASGVVTGVSSGTSVIYYTLPTGCYVTATVTVNALPTAITGTTSVCVGSTTTLSNATAGGTWSSATPSVATIDASGVVTGVSSGTSVISYTLATGCYTTTTVTVNALPAAITGTTTVCQASTTTLSNATAGGTWSSATTSVATINSGGVVTGVSAGTSVITYTLPTGCYVTTTVTVNGRPAAITGTATVCVGSTTTLSDATPGGTWSSSAPARATIDASGVVTGVSAGTTVISYTLPTGCLRTRTVTVYALPTITLGTVSAVCQDATSFSLPYTATTGTPTKYSISAGTPALSGFTPIVDAIFGSSPLIISIPGGSTAGTYQFIITVKNANGCTSTSKTFNLKINPLPAAITGTTTICEGSTTTLSDATAGGTWSSATPSVATINSSGVVTGVSGGTSVISYTLPTGCYVSTTITVNSLPAAITGTTSVCIGSTTTLSNTTSGGTWSSGTPSVATIDAGGIVTSVSVGTSIITYTLPTSCSVSTTVTVNPLPTITLGTVNPVCMVASSFNLPYTATTGTPTTYSISVGTPALAGFTPVVDATLGVSPLTITIPANSTPGTYQFSITVKNGNGCVSTSQNFDLTINALPTVTFTGTLATQCITSATYTLTGGSPAGGTYSGPGVIGTNFDASIAGAGTHTITYTYNDINGCSGSATNTITVNPAISNNTISTTNPAICYNTNAALTGTTPSGGDGINYTYKWQSSTAGAVGPFTDILDANATNKDYTSPVGITQDTWYRRVVSSGPCTDNLSNVIKITVGPVFTVTCTTTSPLCVGSTNGTATANLVGGISPYTYSWNTTPVQTTKTATGLVAGNYTVTVTDNIGCIITGTATVSDPTPLTLGTPTITNITGCYGDASGSIQILAAGGAAPYTYSLYNNGIFVISKTLASGINANFTGLTAGTQYEVRVTDANSCGPVSSGNLTITQPDQVKITDVSTTLITCSGSTDGTITITASGGTGTLEYSINGGGSYQASNVFNVGGGYYDISVRDASGCTVTWPNQIEMVDPDPIVFKFSAISTLDCNGGNTGWISIYDVYGGSGTGYEFSIFTPEVWGTNPNFINLSGGAANPYYIKVRDSKGCIVLGNNGNPIIIAEPNPIDFIVATTNVTGCWYNTNGTIQINSVTGGTGSKQVSIDGINYFTTTKKFTNLGIGNYTIYVRDTKSCIVTKSVTITGPPEIVINTPIITKGVTCYSDTDGEIHATATGGTGVLTYSIDETNYFATGDFVGLAGGDYTLYVKDGNGCVANTTVTVDRPAQLILTLTGTDIKCNGDLPPTGTIDATTTGGVAPLQFRIDGGAWQASGAFTNVAAGPHTVDVIDSHNCTATNSWTISEPSLIAIGTTSYTDPTCSTAGTITVTATGGTGTLVYTLNPGGVTSLTGNFTGLLPGIYTVSVSDDNSCGPVSTAPITISSAALIVINSIDVTHVDGCYGDNTGVITINASGGVGTLTYSIDGGVTTQLSNTFINLSAGNYTVVVNDDANCPQTQPVTINQPAQLVIDNVSFTQMTSAGANDGTITVTASGGTTPLTYTLQPVGTVNGTGVFTGLSDGIYTVLVTDAKGCFVVTNPITLSGLFITVYPHNISCNGLSTGHIGVVPQGGTPPYTILCIQLPGNVTMPDTINLPAGDYIIDVTDFAGYNVKDTVTLTQPDLLVADFVSSMNPSCFGTTDGSVHFNITGGTPPYTITWTGGGTSVGTIATNVPAGTYDFTITDANGCSTVVTGITLTNPEMLNITKIDSVNPLCHGSSDGSITVTATGGTGTYDFAITGDTTLNNTTGIFAGLLAGTYTVSLRDANLCVASSSVPLTVTLSEPDSLIITSNVSDTLVCAYSPEGYIYLDVTGGTPAYSYLWTGGATTQDLLNIGAGTYHVTVTDLNGCTVEKDITVASKAPMLSVDDVTITKARCEFLMESGNDSGSIKINTVSGGNGTIRTYLWDYPITNPTTGPFINNLSSGTYTVTITDEEGCKYGFNFDVPSDTAYAMRAYAYKDTSICHDQRVELIAYPNGPSYRTYTYSWYEFPNTSGVPIGTDDTLHISPSNTTMYYLEIRNDGGCLSTDYTQVEVYPRIGLYIPPYISAVQTIDNKNYISILSGASYNLDVNATSTDYPTTFTWDPDILFEPSDNWNSSIYIDKSIYDQIHSYDTLMVDPQTKRKANFIKVKAKAMTSVGCKDSIRLYVKIVNNLGFGNVFSPNGDGLNDRWEVPKDYLFPDLEIEIYNRWGALVWSAKGDKAAKGWDGRTSNGNELPIGTYYYVVKYNVQTSEGNWSPITGSVTIVR